MAFNINDKVVCVNDSVDSDKAFEIMNDFQRWVEKDKIYFIRDILHNDGIVVGILLKDLYNIPIYIKLIGRQQEPAFGTFRFRKLRKDSSEIFTEEEETVPQEIYETLRVA